MQSGAVQKFPLDSTCRFITESTWSSRPAMHDHKPTSVSFEGHQERTSTVHILKALRYPQLHPVVVSTVYIYKQLNEEPDLDGLRGCSSSGRAPKISEPVHGRKISEPRLIGERLRDAGSIPASSTFCAVHQQRLDGPGCRESPSHGCKS